MAFRFTLGPNLGVKNRLTGDIPEKYSIASIYPNPFNPAMTVVIGLPEAAEMNVQVTNVLGQLIAVLAEGHCTEGFHRFTFNGSNLTSGIYFVHASVLGKMDEVRKVVLMK
ncbi:MAG: T9SS type A sorting domain-containing protein [Proteobacteria bacterium]|nr:T9SS type A sorting domain-containing protein [Pseudomonadota bacterium]